MREQLDEFYRVLDQFIEQTWSIEQPKEFLEAVLDGLRNLCLKVHEIGDEGIKSFEDSEVANPQELERYIIMFDWIPEAKIHLVLWRDIAFQYQKAMVLRSGNDISEEQIIQLHTESKVLVQQAAEHLKGLFNSLLEKVNASSKMAETYLEKQSLKTNPWPIYKQQIETLEAQADALFNQYVEIINTQKELTTLKDGINAIMSSIVIEIERIRTLGVNTGELTKKEGDNAHQSIIHHLDSIEESALALNNLNDYKHLVNEITGRMSKKVRVPVNLDGSRLRYKEINFAHTTKLWLHTEIQPLIMESQEILDGVANNMKMALINVRNRASLTTAKVDDFAKHDRQVLEEFSEALELVIGLIDQKEGEIMGFQEEVALRLEKDLKINSIYSDAINFLGATPQYAISQLKLDQNAWGIRLKNWFFERAGFAKGFIEQVAEEETLSISEKIVRIVKSRQIESENHPYSNIFSTHGYIGESFWVGRQKELNHVVSIINNWKGGYRGSVILSGKRLCGKTVFGELIAHRYFLDNAIRVRPYTPLKVNGRSLDLVDDLGQALEFIKKHTIGEHHLVWIDDLELWQSIKVSASRNVQTLLRHMDELSSQLFFMVSMSNWFRFHYNQMFQLDKVFQAEINLDYMSPDEIRRAIVIRHGATHKVLIDEDENKVGPAEFGQMVQKINGLAGNNIGEALNLWSYFTHIYNEDNVIHKPILNLQLPDFLNDENCILLRTILMNKRTNEYRLRKMMGKAFNEKYQSIVLRLIHTGVLIRHVDGLLEVNEVIVNDVAALLQDAGYIKYRRK